MASLVADVLLDKLLGRWLKLDGHKANLAGGVLKLKNVEIRNDAFAELALPVAVRCGLIGELELEVPWTKLKTESVVIKVHQPVILLAPHSESDWDETLEGQRAAAHKAQALQAVRDAVAASAKTGLEEDSGRSSFVERTIRQIVENMQLLITGAVVRYEDYSHSSSPFAVEVAWDSLWIHPAHVSAPVGGANSSKKSKAKPPFEHREALVCALCIYILQGSKLRPEPQRVSCNTVALTQRIESSGLPLDAPAALRSNANRCCVEPLSFAVEVCTKRTEAPQLPRHVACLETGRLLLDLQFEEVQHVAALIHHFQRFSYLEQHRRFRPPAETRPGDDARAWWQFARAAISYHLNRARAPYRWETIKRRCELRRSFVHLHAKALRKGVTKLTESERTSLRQMANLLSAEDEILFERLAEAKLLGEPSSPSKALLRRRASSGMCERLPSQ